MSNKMSKWLTLVRGFSVVFPWLYTSVYAVQWPNCRNEDNTFPEPGKTLVEGLILYTFGVCSGAREVNREWFQFFPPLLRSVMHTCVCNDDQLGPLFII